MMKQSLILPSSLHPEPIRSTVLAEHEPGQPRVRLAKMHVHRRSLLRCETLVFEQSVPSFPRKVFTGIKLSHCSGSTGVYRVHGKEWRSDPSDFQILDGEIAHEYQNTGLVFSPAVYRTIYVQRAFFETDPVSGSWTRRVEPVQHRADGLRLFWQSHALLSNADTTLAGEESLARLLHLLAAQTGEQTTSGSRSRGRAAVAVKAFLDEHITEQVFLGELAAIAGSSAWETNRAFSRKFGLPPHEYQRARRIDLARAMLTDGVPASQVALEVGYVDQSHFSRHFKRIVGVPPGRYGKAAIH